jgi:hypothetical protein
MDLSDQVFRYDSKEQYIEFKNHLRQLATGELVDFPDWGKDPKEYWKVFYERMEKDPDQVFEMWTLLEDEDINEDGSLERQHVRYETLRYENKEEARKSQEIVFLGTQVDPGVPVSNDFTSLRQAERMRSLLMKGEPGYYYAIKHKTACDVIDSPVNVP